jgi:hypothetical protein
MMRPGYLSHGWLPAVLPADATQLRVRDAALAYTLRAAGAEIVDQEAEVEIGSLDDISFNAPTTIVPLDPRIPDSQSRVRQMVGRVAASADVRVRTAQATAALRQRGFSHIQVVWWDRDQAIRLPGLECARSQHLAEAFPRRVLIVAGRERPGPTVLDRAVADAERRTGLRLEIVRPLVSSGTLVVMLEGHVLRVAVGSASQLIEQQANALAALRGLNPVQAVLSRVPELLATGTAGLADWSLEQRLPGVKPPWVLTPRLLDASIEFLVALHQLASHECDGFVPARLKRLTASPPAALPSAVLDALGDLAADIEEETGRLPRAFFHGDFSTQNLLVRDDELVGVVDWAQADPAGLPLLDVMNLELLNATQPAVYEWGPSIASYLLPLARRGGSDPMQRYAHAIGIDCSARQLECLVLAYWLDRVSHQLATYVDRSIDPLWLERSITSVLSAVEVARR